MTVKRSPNTISNTRSGIQIEYWDAIGLDGLPQQRRYAVNGQKFPSVSTICNQYDKPQLVEWAARQAREGKDWRQTRDEAAERGTAAHDVLVELLSRGKVPNPAEHPEEWRGYIRAGVNWYLEYEPEAIQGEVIVASPKHGFAGRFDLLAKMQVGNLLGLCRVDFKTVSEWHYTKDKDGNPTDELLPPYEEHASQVKLYEIAARESGYLPSHVQAIVRLGPDGAFDMTETWATEENALGHVAAYRNLEDQRHRGQKRRRIVRAEAKAEKKRTAAALGQAA